MPAEAIHLSVLEDTLPALCAFARRATAGPQHQAAARVGALFVDLPYFDRFPQAVLNYLLKRPPFSSPWGDTNHHQMPIARGRLLGEKGVLLSRSAATREAGEYLVALSLGYFCHAAADTSMHPLVNRLAAERAARLGDTHSRQHQEVEKYQSILFHEQRLGFDFMGRPELSRYVTIDPRPLLRSAQIARAVDEVLRALHGEAPGVAAFRRWARGYRQYVWLISGPFGKTVAPEAVKRRERGWAFDEVDFPTHFAAAVAQSQRWVNLFAAYLADGVFDEPSRAAFHAQIPEGTIDPGGPQSAEPLAAPVAAG